MSQSETGLFQVKEIVRSDSEYVPGAPVVTGRSVASFRTHVVDEFELPMRLMDTRPWLLIITLTIVLVLALMWATLGTVATHVRGAGFLFSGAGTTLAVTSEIGGQLEAILVRPGDAVSPNDTIALLRHRELENAVGTTQQALSRLAAARHQVKATYDQYVERQLTALKRKRENLRLLIESGENAVRAQRQILDAYDILRGRGAISRVEHEVVREKYYASETNLAQTRTVLSQLEADEVEYESQSFSAVRDYDLRILELENRLGELKTKMELGREVRSISSGYVATIDAGLNTILPPGGQVATLSFNGAVLEAIIFLDPSTGKQILPGMLVHVSPSTVVREEFGMMIGTVLEVGGVPEKRSSMMALLNNDVLVDQFTITGAPLLVRVGLLRDPNSPNGFKWTSGRGPSVQFTSGTPATADVVVREQAPISLVLPILRRWLGLRS